MKGFFVTGTDTGVGKTMVCGLLAAFLRSRGVNVVTQKWVQTGSGTAPLDLATHRRLMGLPEAVPEGMLEDLCPYRLSFPSSPHLAAEREGRIVEAAVIEEAYRRLEASHDIVLAEGVGGFLVPMARGILTCDIVARLGLAVLVVVANRLGCVNHALLTVEAVRQRGIPLAGMIFNRPPGGMRWAPEEVLADNPRIVEEISRVPLLGEVPYLADPFSGADAFVPVGQAFLDRWRSP